MNISVENIGKLKSASIEIAGISVIAGENNTGKSTIGKALFSTFNSFFDIENRIAFERKDSIESEISSLCHYAFYAPSRRTHSMAKSISQEIIEDFYGKAVDFENLKNAILTNLQQFSQKYELRMDEGAVVIEKSVRRIQSVLNISDDEIFRFILDKKISGEFGGQVNNIFSELPGSIRLQISGEDISVEIADDKVDFVQNRINLLTEAVYIDDPNVLDGPEDFPIFGESRYADHREDLRAKLRYRNKKENIVDEILANKKFAEIYDKISTICSGEIAESDSSKIGYLEDGTNKVLEMKNLSMGLKTFVILKTLLEKGEIGSGGMVILDEPEIHLHPEWQLLFAELIVMLQKEFSLHVLLNTHSPYFLRAIQVYAGKYEVEDKCKYYLAEEVGKMASIEDVTCNVDKIYAKLAKPFQDLENERWQSD